MQQELERDATSFLKHQVPERPESSRPRPSARTRRSNPPLPRSREVVIRLPCPQQYDTFKDKGKRKVVDVEGKGKGKME
jgi:hypothetical protein